MSRKIPKQPHTTAPASVKAAAPGFWQATLLPILERRALVIAIALIALATARIGMTYSEISSTWDEPGHMACGLQYLSDHVYRYESQHPPLARVASALGPFLSGARPLGGSNQDLEGVAVMFHSGNPGRILTLMRLGLLPFFVLAAFVVFLWAKRHFGGAVAVFAVALFTLEPTVLAHAGVATTDIALTACLSAAFFALLLWAEEPTWKHSVLLGFATGLAVTSKFTALGFLPVAAIFALLGYAAIERPSASQWISAAKLRALPFAVAVGTGALLIWAVYSFGFGNVGGWNISLPAPELFDGVRSALRHNDTGHAAYLLGQIRNVGWWYFFPVVFFFKTPAGWLALIVIGVAVCVLRRGRVVYWFPLAFALGILIPAMTSHVNIGLRHILPIYCGLSIVAAVGLVRLMEIAKWTPAAAAALVLWIAFSGAAQHPDYIGYFNAFAGDHPERIVLDSDLDWGQNTIRLARRLRELGATQVAFSEFGFTPRQLMEWPGLPPVRPIDPLVPAEGWNAVSPTRWILRRYGLSDPNRQPWFVYLRPVEKVGSLWLYYVPPGSLPRQ